MVILEADGRKEVKTWLIGYPDIAEGPTDADVVVDLIGAVHHAVEALGPGHESGSECNALQEAV